MESGRVNISEHVVSGRSALRMKSGCVNISEHVVSGRNALRMESGRVNIVGRVIILVMMALLFLWGAGCTEYERSGFSAIPQNSPASWELAPYGDLRN